MYSHNVYACVYVHEWMDVGLLWWPIFANPLFAEWDTWTKQYYSDLTDDMKVFFMDKVEQQLRNSDEYDVMLETLGTALDHVRLLLKISKTTCGRTVGC